MIVHLELRVDAPDAMSWDDVAERVRGHVEGTSIRVTARSAIVIDSAYIDEAEDIEAGDDD